MRSALALSLIALAMVACKSTKQEAPAQGPAPAAATAAPIAPGTEMPKDATHAVVLAGAAQPKAAGAEIPADALQGKVLERIDASPYCYLRLKTAKGEVWAAVPEAKVEKGADVAVLSPMLMPNFESKTLKRTFAEVYFGTLASSGTPAATPTAANPHAGIAQVAPVKVGKVEKAEGADARTVAELWAQSGSLKDKTVTLRGKVVKYSPGVMGKNWMHLQDGSGDEAKGTHDITVTSQDEVAKGDTVTIKGTVRANKDFGAGYSYALIVEEAKVIKK